MKNQLNIVTTLEAVSHVKSGNRVYLQGAAMTPNVLFDALCEPYYKLKKIEIFQNIPKVKPYILKCLLRILKDSTPALLVEVRGKP